jgi:hypothetical protein
VLAEPVKRADYQRLIQDAGGEQVGDLRQRVQHDADVLARIEERLRRQTHPFSQDPSVLKRTIADGVARGLFGYAVKDAQDRFEPLYFNTALGESEVEFSDETFLLTADEARKRTEPPGWHVWS